MARHRSFLALLQWLLIFSVNSSLTEEKDKYLRSLITYLNNLPNALFNYEDGFLLNIQDAGKGDHVEAIIKASELYDGNLVKVFKCQALVSQEDDQVFVNQHRCLEVEEKVSHATESELQVELTQVAEPLFVQEVKLENEVQPDNWVTSGEQFIAIPRVVPVSPCVGCSSNVDVTAPGVTDLALIGLQHLDRHNPTHKHTLAAILEVQRQVQVVNGVRFILTLNINFNNCTEVLNNDCEIQKCCKITILEKPWIKLPNGSKFRAVISNNCTEEWLFDENEDLPSQPENKGDTISKDDNLKAVHDSGLQSQIVKEKELSEEELKNIQKQIIPHDNISYITDAANAEHTDNTKVYKNEVTSYRNDDIIKKSAEKSESGINPAESNPSIAEVTTSQPISEDKKRAIDDLIKFFDSADPSPKQVEYRVRRNIIKSDTSKKFGSLVEQDPNKMEFVILAQKSLTKYHLDSSQGTLYKISKIHKVTTQTVQGSLTRIDFDIKPLITTNNGEVLYCHSEIWSRPWLPNSEEITVKCNEGSRSKRNAVVGGQTEQDPSDAKYKVLAEKSLIKFQNQVSNSKNTHKIVSINKVTTQVVAGVLTRIDFDVSPVMDSSVKLQCHSEIWERPWLPNSEEITINCNEKSRSKRSAVPGGQTEQDPSSEKYKVLAEKSLMKFQNQESNLKNTHKIVSINKVTTQVVAGVLTRIDFDVSPVTDSSVKLQCHSEIWERPWLPNSEEITINCNEKSRSKRSAVPGGQTEQDPSSEKYNVLAEKSLMKFQNQESNLKNTHKIVSINKVTTQVVAGVLTRIDFDVSPVMDSSLKLQCHSEIWERPWLPNSEEITINCNEKARSKRDNVIIDHSIEEDPSDTKYKEMADNVNARMERSLNLGAPVEQDPSKKEFNDLAEKSLKVFYETSDSEYLHKVVNISKVTIQPASGTITSIDFYIAPTICSKKDMRIPAGEDCLLNGDVPEVFGCHSEIWSRPWLPQGEEITIHCNLDSAHHFNESVQITNLKLNNNLLAEEALTKYELMSRSEYAHKITKFNKVINVNGNIIIFDFIITPTNCLLKDINMLSRSKCDVQEPTLERQCRAEIWERPWLTKGEKEITISCDLDILIEGIKKDPKELYTTDRHKRYLHDNESLKNSIHLTRNTTMALYIDYRPLENYPKEAELAEGLSNEVLKHVEAKYPYLYKQKVLRVLSLRKHRISEERYKVKFEVGYTNCSALTLRKDCEVIDTDLKILCKGDVTLAHHSLRVTHVSCEEKEHNTDIYEHIQADYLFREFVTTYRPSYKDDRIAMANRYNIFKDNVKKMHQFNTLETGTATYGVTKFSDLTYEEFSKNYMGLKMNLRNENEVPMLQALVPDTDVLNKFDWRDQGVVTEVKNQGSCGSCWAFSVTGNIEGQWKLKKGELISLSEQELVDCDKLDQGCNGGLPDNAYRAIEELGGLETESDYPYEAVKDKCMFNKTMTKVQISGAVNITSNEVDMAKWLTKNGPISIGINANAMQFYVGGVSHPWHMLCNPENLDHGVLIVGYGTKEYPVFKKNLPYWTIKNSWGKTWGEQGYYRVYRGDGTCGVNKMASSAVV